MTKTRIKNFLTILGGICLVNIFLVSVIMICCWMNKNLILNGLASGLIQNTYQPFKSYDGLILLMGSLEDRSLEAAKIYSKDKSMNLYLIDSESSYLKNNLDIIREVELCKQYLNHYGVPLSKIYIFKAPHISPSRSTKEEAKNFLHLIQSKQINGNRFLLVTSWFHSRRALKIFNSLKKTEPDLEFDVFATPRPDPLYTWIREERDFLNVFTEYIKWIHNFYLLA